MSATIAPPPRPPMPAAAGATQGMPAPQNQLHQRFMQLVAGVTQLVQVMSRTPGVNQQLLQQAAQKFQEGAVLLDQAARGSQQGAGPSGAGAAPPPPGAPPPGPPPQ